jgi:hypothetical protein
MKDWKTTLAGALTIAGTLTNAALALLEHRPVDLPIVIAGITTGVGLIKAADSR